MSTKSHLKLLEEWEALLAGLKATAPHFDNTAFLQAFLTQALREAREIRKRQEQLTVARHEAQKKLQQILDHGHDKAMRTRNYLRFHLGPYNEELTRFGINPIRRGGARKKPAADVAPENEAV